jgi:secretion/DNA translocation related TadE-like protein
MRRAVDRGDESGVATIWAVWSIVVVLSVAWVGLALGVAAARQHHLDGAADLVAISAATELSDGRPACASAGRVADANRVTLMRCVVDGTDVVVSVSDRLRLPPGFDANLVATARAGPR